MPMERDDEQAISVEQEGLEQDLTLDSLEAGDFNDEANDLPEADAAGEEAKKRPCTLSVKLSRSLYRKLVLKAEAEGVALQDLASELLAEGLVLRAWEIMERKSAMRQGNGNAHGQGNQQGSRANNNKVNYRNNNQATFNRGRTQQKNNNYNHSNSNHTNRRNNYHHILEDSANFLEYVRSQEKKNNNT